METMFSKQLTDTDLKKRLSIPTQCLNHFRFDKGHSTSVQVEDENGKAWQFKCRVRREGYQKPVFCEGWLKFVRYTNLRPGDRVEFYKDTEAEGLYRIQVQRRVKLLGKEFWANLRPDEQRINFEERTEAAAKEEK
ncbi:Uncharacterized protein TCM_042511 [Theobroma cacao]|uniref:TF-B3 domain-containing protein n=1 Tax=Theobroma cacao TaxID=3641 RepID=A0A061FM90_THECC|nr:Uncharacterized protein TCM_042511 [Theobroma cacao]